MLTHRICIFILPAILLCFSCEKDTKWDFQNNEKFLVANCIITNELKQHELLLYWSSEIMNQQSEGLSGALIELSDGEKNIAFVEDTSFKGRYVSETAFIASAGKIYSIVIKCEEGTDTAFAEMTGVTPLEAPQIVPMDSMFQYVFSPEGSAYMLEIFYDWSFYYGYPGQYDPYYAAETFYHLNNIDMGKIFAPDRKPVLFPHQTKIIRRKYSLNAEHQKFIRSLLLETEWRGGIFDIQQNNVPTNFNHFIHGWFAACAVESDSLFFE